MIVGQYTNGSTDLMIGDEHDFGVMEAVMLIAGDGQCDLRRLSNDKT
jgi:hypothetical protein